MRKTHRLLVLACALGGVASPLAVPQLAMSQQPAAIPQQPAATSPQRPAPSGVAESPSEGGQLLFQPGSGLDALLGRQRRDEGPRIEVSAQYTVDDPTGPGNRTGQLSVTAKLGSGWHIYSITQPEGGPQRTQLVVAETNQSKLTGSFVPDHPPHVRTVEYFTAPLEEHDGKVTWRAPVQFTDRLPDPSLEITGEVMGQICNDQAGCVPLDGIDTKFVARYAGVTPVELPSGSRAAVASPPAPPSPGTASSPSTPPPPNSSRSPRAAPLAGAVPLRPPHSHATLHGTMSPRQIQPGGTVRLTLSATIDPQWYLYALAEPDREYAVSKPTRIALQVPADWEVGPVYAVPEAREVASGVPDEPIKRYHSDSVRWSIDVTVPASLSPGTYPLEGSLGFQTCSSVCDPPTGVHFVAHLQVGSATVAEELPLRFTDAPYTESQRSVAGSATLDLDNLVVSQDELSLGYVLALAFLGGFVLNFMPCVLPVIGLKIMSFVQQAGEDRGRVLTLNLWYVLGILSIFMLLATLAAAASLGLGSQSLGWGEQFNYDAFNIVLIAVVFTMGLSFMGVWEIPIPGFVGGGKADAVAQREGPFGAFAKGVLTTILATPCSGPGLATALAWAAGKPPHLVYGVFACMGLGMSVPYLALGLNPKLIRFLPKPGAWMETFKQLMGLVLLATALYLLTLVTWVHVFPTLMLLLALAAACWWIGRVPITASSAKKWGAWVTVSVFCVVVGIYAFGDLLMLGGRPIWALRGTMRYRLAAFVDSELNQRLDDADQEIAETNSSLRAPENHYELPWERFSSERLADLTAQQRTVMVDFTARWCLTCKFLEAQVLNTPEVREVVDANGVVPLVADWSDRDPDGDVGKLLAKLGSRQVPVLAIFPAGRPNEPIVLMGGYKQGTLLQKLKGAGPSQSAEPAASTASLR